ncbi:MAG: PIN domain-containing protein [Micrococcales bacterium]|nr:PIN domain-containing protein [Micrococcales bacterium]
MAAQWESHPILMLDTNAVVEVLRRPRGQVAAHLSELLPGQAAISVVVLGELRYGVARAQAAGFGPRLEALAACMPVLPLDRGVAERYGAIRADLARRGTPIGMNDLWIAAHALSLGLALVTDNEKEIRRVPGLVVENWLRPKQVGT